LLDKILFSIGVESGIVTASSPFFLHTGRGGLFGFFLLLTEKEDFPLATPWEIRVFPLPESL